MRLCRGIFTKNPIILDHESEKEKLRRGRPPVPSAQVLKAADSLFAAADSPGTVTLDAIAAASRVGTGTLFRAFGSREGLLNALWAAKLAALRDGVQERACYSARRRHLESALLHFSTRCCFSSLRIFT
jgi:AcrR family transcriptional regulator